MNIRVSLQKNGKVEHCDFENVIGVDFQTNRGSISVGNAIEKDAMRIDGRGVMAIKPIAPYAILVKNTEEDE